MSYNEKDKIQKREYQRKNRVKINADHKRWRDTHKESFSASRKKYYLKNKEWIDKYRWEWNRKKRIQERMLVIEKYGGRCNCCGEDREVFLCIDHIHGGGGKHIRSLSIPLPRWIIKNNYPDLFQILCHNCNYAKFRNGICPHNNSL